VNADQEFVSIFSQNEVVGIAVKGWPEADGEELGKTYFRKKEFGKKYFGKKELGKKYLGKKEFRKEKFSKIKQNQGTEVREPRELLLKRKTQYNRPPCKDSLFY